MKDTSIRIVPEPLSIEASGRTHPFDGFRDLPRRVARELAIPSGSWKLTRVDGQGNGVEVKAGSISFWGEENLALATVAQLARQFGDSLPEAKIVEQQMPAFRGLSLDIARGGVPTVDTLKRMIRWLFLLKYNHLSIYMEDLFPWKSHPEIGALRGRLTEREVSEVTRYGADLGIEVSPSLNLAGHMEHILCVQGNWGLSEWHRTREGVLDLSNPRARDLAYELLAEVVQSWPSRHIHVGGDETWALGRGKGLDKTWTYRGPELYEAHHRRLIEIVREAGKVPLIWGDIICGSIQMGDMISKEAAAKWTVLLESDAWRGAIIANWIYNPVEPVGFFRDKIRVFKDRGLAQVACPSLRNSGTFYPNFARATHNSECFIKAARDEGIDGFLVTSWGDLGSACLFSFIDPLILAAIDLGFGGGSWGEKWKALTGEDEKTLRARTLFGAEEVSQHIMNAILLNHSFAAMPEDKRGKILANWRSALEETSGMPLPDDLRFFRLMLETGVKVAAGEARASDYISLARQFAALWRRERRPEGLEINVAKLWGAAGRVEEGLLRSSLGWMPPN